MKTFTDFIEEIFERAEEEDERDKPDRNVVMQARKAVNMGSKDITFHDGKTHNVSRAHAQKFLHKHTTATRDNKLSIQNHAQQSHKNFMSHVSEDTSHETESGTAKITDTHVHFDNSGYKQKFSHKEVHNMNKGKRVRGFSMEKDNPYHGKDNHVYSNGDEEHHLPTKHMSSLKTEEIISYEEGTGSKVCQQCDNGKTETGSTCKPCGGTGYDMSSAKPAKPEIAKEGKAYGPTGVSYAVPKGHKDEVDPKTREKYPERQKPETKSEALVGDQHKLDHNKDKKITKSDMKMVRKVGAVKQSNPDNYKPFNKEEIKLIDKTGSYVSKKETYAEQMANMMTNLIIKTNVKVEEAKGTHVTKDGKVAKKGLWYNIAQKKKRGGEPAEVGDADRPSAADMKRSQ